MRWHVSVELYVAIVLRLILFLKLDQLTVVKYLSLSARSRLNYFSSVFFI